MGQREEIKEALEALRKCDMEDNEEVHAKYDDLAFLIAEQYEPAIMKTANKMTEGVGFWHA